MTSEMIGKILERQRRYYKSGVTIPVSFRIEQLKKLYAAIKKYENEIAAALEADLGKSAYESFMCETGLVLSEITYMICHPVVAVCFPQFPTACALRQHFDHESLELSVPSDHGSPGGCHRRG